MLVLIQLKAQVEIGNTIQFELDAAGEKEIAAVYIQPVPVVVDAEVWRTVFAP